MNGTTDTVRKIALRDKLIHQLQSFGIPIFTALLAFIGSILVRTPYPPTTQAGRDTSLVAKISVDKRRELYAELMASLEEARLYSIQETQRELVESAKNVKRGFFAIDPFLSDSLRLIVWKRTTMYITIVDSLANIKYRNQRESRADALDRLDTLQSAISNDLRRILFARLESR